jgi:type IV secretion system protein VirB4
MINEASTLLDSDASNKAADADLALQELGSDMIGQAYVTATLPLCLPRPRPADRSRKQKIFLLPLFP